MLKSAWLNSYDSFFEKYFELLDKPSNMMDKLKLLPRLNEITQMMPKISEIGTMQGSDNQRQSIVEYHSGN